MHPVEYFFEYETYNPQSSFSIEERQNIQCQDCELEIQLKQEFRSAIMRSEDYVVDGVVVWHPGDPIPNPGSEYNRHPVTSMYGIFENIWATELDLSLWDTSRIRDMCNAFANCHSLEALDLSNFDMSNVITTEKMFHSDSVLKEIKMGQWTLGELRNGKYMFNKCTALDLEPRCLTNWGLGKLRDGAYMFAECQSLEVLPCATWELHCLEDADSMFAFCENLIHIGVSSWGLEKLEDARKMFFCCTKLKELEGVQRWRPQRLENINYMFFKCHSLTSLPLSEWGVAAVTSAAETFGNCHSLESVDISPWALSHVTTTAGMFQNCWALQNLGMLYKTNMDLLADTRYMFDGCHSLKTLFLNWEFTAKASLKNMSFMFLNCKSLAEVNLSTWQTLKGKPVDINGMFCGCASLKTVTFPKLPVRRICNVSNVNNLFHGCKSLNSVHMGSVKVKEPIGMSAFHGCLRLRHVWAMPTEEYKYVPFLDDGIFSPA